MTALKLKLIFARTVTLAFATVVGFAILLMIVSPRLALAHASLVSAQPAAGATVTPAPHSVVIHFDDQIEKMFATLKVQSSAGDDVAIGKPAVGADPHQLSVELKPLAAGSYTVKWSVVSEDGHRTQGSYSFTVAAPKP